MKSAQEQFEDKEGWISYGGNIEQAENLDPEALVFCKFRSGCEYVSAKPVWSFFWHHDQSGSDIVAYKIYKEENQLEHNSNNNHTTKQSNGSIEQIIKEYFEIKETIETKQKELDVLKDSLDTKYKELVEKGKSFNVSISIIDNNETTKTEELLITDWRDLKVGDIIWWSGDSCSKAGEYKVLGMEDKGYAGSATIYLGDGNWVDITSEQWRFVSRLS